MSALKPALLAVAVIAAIVLVGAIVVQVATDRDDPFQVELQGPPAEPVAAAEGSIIRPWHIQDARSAYTVAELYQDYPGPTPVARSQWTHAYVGDVGHCRAVLVLARQSLAKDEPHPTATPRPTIMPTPVAAVLPAIPSLAKANLDNPQDDLLDVDQKEYPDRIHKEEVPTPTPYPTATPGPPIQSPDWDDWHGRPLSIDVAGLASLAVPHDATVISHLEIRVGNASPAENALMRSPLRTAPWQEGRAWLRLDDASGRILLGATENKIDTHHRLALLHVDAFPLHRCDGLDFRWESAAAIQVSALTDDPYADWGYRPSNQGSGLPTGGDEGQLLSKKTASDQDAWWVSLDVAAPLTKTRDDTNGGITIGTDLPALPAKQSDARPYALSIPRIGAATWEDAGETARDAVGNALKGVPIKVNDAADMITLAAMSRGFGGYWVGSGGATKANIPADSQMGLDGSANKLGTNVLWDTNNLRYLLLHEESSTADGTGDGPDLGDPLSYIMEGGMLYVENTSSGKSGWAVMQVTGNAVRYADKAYQIPVKIVLEGGSDGFSNADYVKINVQPNRLEVGPEQIVRLAEWLEAEHGTEYLREATWRADIERSFASNLTNASGAAIISTDNDLGDAVFGARDFIGLHQDNTAGTNEVTTIEAARAGDYVWVAFDDRQAVNDCTGNSPAPGGWLLGRIAGVDTPSETYLRRVWYRKIADYNLGAYDECEHGPGTIRFGRNIANPDRAEFWREYGSGGTELTDATMTGLTEVMLSDGDTVTAASWVAWRAEHHTGIQNIDGYEAGGSTPSAGQIYWASGAISINPLNEADKTALMNKIAKGKKVTMWKDADNYNSGIVSANPGIASGQVSFNVENESVVGTISTGDDVTLMVESNIPSTEITEGGQTGRLYHVFGTPSATDDSVCWDNTNQRLIFAASC